MNVIEDEKDFNLMRRLSSNVADKTHILQERLAHLFFLPKAVLLQAQGMLLRLFIPCSKC